MRDVSIMIALNQDNLFFVEIHEVGIIVISV